jgi:DNA-binding MarR family transcriptional regulator
MTSLADTSSPSAELLRPSPRPGVAVLAADLTEAARLLVRSASRAAGPGERQGLTGAQFDLLRHVGRHPGESVAEAASRLGLARNTVSTLVGQLCQAGLLERVPDARDGRVARLRLQPAAEQRMAAWRTRRTSAVAAALDLLTEDERDLLTRALPTLQRVGHELDLAARSGPPAGPGQVCGPGGEEGA